jgi:ferrochelatase
MYGIRKVVLNKSGIRHGSDLAFHKYPFLAKLGLKEDQYTVCFQSRLDKKWLTPFSDKIVEEQAKKGAKKLLVFSPAFVADCLETIVEIGSEYQEIFEEHGGEKVQLVPSSNDHPLVVKGLEGMIRERL